MSAIGGTAVHLHYAHGNLHPPKTTRLGPIAKVMVFITVDATIVEIAKTVRNNQTAGNPAQIGAWTATVQPSGAFVTFVLRVQWALSFAI